MAPSSYQPSTIANPTYPPSIVYSVIPTVIRSRIPIVTSFRKTLRYALPSALTLHGPTPIQHPQLLDDTSRSCTTSGASTPSTRPSTPEDLPIAVSAETSGSPESRNLQAGGVDWSTAYTGANIWVNAWRQLPTQHQNPTAVRAMHVDALRYMHMALPDDLTAAETELIRDSLRHKIPLGASHQSFQLTPKTASETTPQNALRSSVSQTVCMFIALMLFVLPLLLSCFDRLARYEREHSLSDKLVKKTQSAVKSVGNMSVDVGSGAIKLKNSPVGAYFLSTSAWTLQSILAGVNDGIIQSSNNYYGKAQPI